VCRGMGEPAVIRQFIRVIADGNHRGPGNHAGVEAGRGLSKNREVLQDGRISVSVLRAMPDASVLVFDASLRFVLVGGEALARQGFSPERTPDVEAALAEADASMHLDKVHVDEGRHLTP